MWIEYALPRSFGWNRLMIGPGSTHALATNSVFRCGTSCSLALATAERMTFSIIPLARCLANRSMVIASSTSRPFELAMSGATIVSNPHEGIERWFEPGRELLVVENADQATDAYARLLDDPAQAEEMGRAARERALDEHTFLHRARRLLGLLGVGLPEAVRG